MRSTVLALFLAPVTLTFGCGEPDEGDGTSFQTMDADNESDAGTGTGVPTDLPGTDSGTADTTTTATATDTTTGTATDTDTDATGATDTDPTDSSTTGSGMCGNGTIETGEQCDGSNLNNFSCTDLGFSGGTLACDAVTCTFNTASCTTNPGSTGF